MFLDGGPGGKMATQSSRGRVGRGGKRKAQVSFCFEKEEGKQGQKKPTDWKKI